jgi:hypothetical protein
LNISKNIPSSIINPLNIYYFMYILCGIREY